MEHLKKLLCDRLNVITADIYRTDKAIKSLEEDLHKHKKRKQDLETEQKELREHKKELFNKNE